MEKKISIIIPVYNCGKYLERCFDSLLKQNIPHEEYEVIVINDGSTDNSSKIIEKYAKKYENFFVVIDKENSGVSDSRNIGIEIANGELITFVDADDFLEKNILKEVYEEYKKSGEDIFVYGYCNYSSKDRREYIKITDENEIEKRIINILIEFSGVWGKFYRKKVILENKIFFDKSLRIGEDLDWLIRLFFCSKKIKIENENIYYYYQNENSVCRTSNYKIFDVKRIFEKNMKQFRNEIGYLEITKPVLFIHFCYTVNRFFKMKKDEQKFYKEELIEFKRRIYSEYSEKNIYFKNLKFKNKLRYYLFKYDMYRVYKLIHRIGKNG